MWILAGLLIALPVAATLAGNYLLLAAAIAAVPAAIAVTAREPLSYPGVWTVWYLRPIALLSLVAALASAFGTYVLPEYQKLAAAGIVIVIAILYRYLRFPRALLWLAATGALGASAWYHRDSAPEFAQAPGFLHLDGPTSWWRIGLAALVLFAVLVPLPSDHTAGAKATGRFVAGVLLGGSLTWAALHWLGTDLSLTFARDLVAITQVPPLFSAAAVISAVAILTTVAAYDVFSEAMLATDELIGVLAAGALVFAGPLIVMLVAGALMLTYAIARFVTQAKGLSHR